MRTPCFFCFVKADHVLSLIADENVYAKGQALIVAWHAGNYGFYPKNIEL